MDLPCFCCQFSDIDCGVPADKGRHIDSESSTFDTQHASSLGVQKAESDPGRNTEYFKGI